MEHTLMLDIAVCIIAAWVLAVLFQTAKQPLLLAYLLAGFAIGPHGFRWVTDAESIETIASIGLVLLLFMIGLEIDLKRMISMGKVIITTSAVQILSGLAAGWLFFKLTGLADEWLEALYLGMAVALSSTVILVKILHQKRELDTLAGRITLGVLVLQDLAAIVFLAVQPNLKSLAAGSILLALGKVGVLVFVCLAVSRYLLPPVFKAVAMVPELVLVGALAWCFAITGLADNLKLSREMGALVAGVAISTYPYTLDVTAKVTSIRDFFLTLFFVGLGMSIPVPTWALLSSTLAVCLFLIGSRLVTVFTPLYRLQQGHRMSLLPALYLCQMSELSLVLLALGRGAGDVSQESLSLAAFAFSLLAIGSTYTAFNSDAILHKLSPLLTRIGLPDLPPTPAGQDADHLSKRIVILGFSRTASSLLEEITREKPALLSEIGVVDFNPAVTASLRQRGVQVRHGDISHRDVLLHGGVSEADIIICSVPNSLLKGTNNLTLLRHIRELNPQAKIITNAESLAEIQELYSASSDYVTSPRLLEADDLLDALSASQQNLLDQKREKQKSRLTPRRESIP